MESDGGIPISSTSLFLEPLNEQNNRKPNVSIIPSQLVDLNDVYSQVRKLTNQ